MAYLTLREICELTGVSRRAIQGYEKAGLVSAIDRNARGHLLYDTKSQERIQLIKLFQQLGFSIKEIQMLIDSPEDMIKEAVENQIEKLKERKDEIDLLIQKAYQLIEQLKETRMMEEKKDGKES